MTFRDRLAQAAITTPDGQRYVFGYEDVEKTINKKTSSYIFSDEDGALVQDFGFGEINYPLTVYFSGPDYDLEADRFDKSISAKGVIILEHPLYGIKNVIVSSVTRRDSLKTAGAQGVFVLEMTETIVQEAPIAVERVRDQSLDEIDAYNTTNAESFEEGFNVDDPTDEVSAKQRFLDFVNGYKETFNNLTRAVNEITTTFNQIANFITSNIDALLSSPLELATAVQRLIATPARLSVSIESRIRAYKTQYDRLFADPLGNGTIDIKNQRLEKQLFVTGILASMSETYLFGTFRTKNDAISGAEALRSDYFAGQDFLDEQQKQSLNDRLLTRFNVSDSVTQGIKKITADVAFQLLRLSFSLDQERRIILGNNTDMFTLCFQLYGSVDNEFLDFFISTNNLTGVELIAIPKGKEIVYYV